MYTLFRNGIIHTFDDNRPITNCLLILNDRIVFTGSEDAINIADQKLKIIDLEGKHIYPGFIDCHTHVASVALDKMNLRLDNCRSLKAALQMVVEFADKRTPGSWILGGGWNANIWEDGSPHKKYLDKLVPKHPVALYNKDGHGQWLNSLAMDTCGFTTISDTPVGGKLGCDSNGELSGMVYEKACDFVNKKVGTVSSERLKQCMRLLLPELYAFGITSVHSCESLEIWRLFQKLRQQRDLKIRICMHPPVEHMDEFIRSGLCSGYGNEWLRLGGLKYFVDGSLGSPTAEMHMNYNDTNHAGIEVITEAELFENLQHSTRSGLGATIHAIGDKANFKALNALEGVLEISNEKGLRNRIEHAQILQERDIVRFGSLDIIASMQPLHISDDVKIADKFLGERVKWTYAVKSLQKVGCRVVFGSDMPVADPDPIKGIRAAVGQRCRLDENEPSWHPDQSITITKTLHAYTRDAAFSSYEESLKGTLSPGKLADFIALPIDLESGNENSLAEVGVEMTILGGEIVYQE